MPTPFILVTKTERETPCDNGCGDRQPRPDSFVTLECHSSLVVHEARKLRRAAAYASSGHGVDRHKSDLPRIRRQCMRTGEGVGAALAINVYHRLQEVSNDVLAPQISNNI